MRMAALLLVALVAGCGESSPCCPANPAERAGLAQAERERAAAIAVREAVRTP